MPRDDERLPPHPPKSNVGLVLGIIAGGLVLFCGLGIAGIYFVVRKAHDKVQEVVQQIENAQHLAQDKETEAHLQMIVRAAHNYHDTTTAMPANTYHNQTRQPLLSWRVHLLPYLEEVDLYRQFKLDEPWDSAHNVRLLPQMPAIYATSESRRKNLNERTFIRGLTGPGGAFENRSRNHLPQGPHFTDFTDGLSNVVFAFESSEAVEWTKPDELAWPANMARPAGIPNDWIPAGSPEYFWVVLGDERARRVKRKADNDALRRIFIRNDMQPLLPSVWYEP